MSLSNHDNDCGPMRPIHCGPMRPWHCGPMRPFKKKEFWLGFLAGVVVTLLVGWGMGWLAFS